MNSMRQLGTALFYALVSVVLVVGGLSLAMAEGGLKASSATAQPTATLLGTSTARGNPEIATVTTWTPVIVSMTATQPVVITQLVTATAQPVTSTSAAIATVYIYPTSTSRVYYPPTPKRCGPYYGWIKAYTVQQGDTLYHISTMYRTTVTELQVANCLPGTFIYPGQLLWVPNVPTITPGATIIPTFDTPTSEPPTLTPIPPTDTAVPSATDTPVTPNP